ncbi:MAG: molybdopterin-dependent oxidoreductase [Thermodesulfobacteriota bacterium]|nr:molybdopterin-dependent oxidoreductase [Thermodesulfobacteriota bacterium]
MMKTQTINLTIDGVPVAVDKGRTILEAAQSAGVRIPTLCHDRRLSPLGACCICVVQEKGNPELQPACFTPVRNGMEIITQSPEIIDARRLQLQLILLNHPMICPWCEKEGGCVLQNLVYEYGVEDTRFTWEKISFPLDDSSFLLQRDPNKCILCGRCVRICDEVQGIGELSFTRRGMETLIDTDFHRPIDCEFCGQCLDTCPVGAITSDCFDYKTKVWELKETTTPCPYCGCGCLLTIGSKEGEIKQVFSDPAQGPSDGNLCVKGRFGWDVSDSPERLKNPLLRVNGIHKEASWDEALGFVVHRLEEIRDRYGSERIGALASSRLTNEECYLFKKLFQEALQTSHLEHDGARACLGLTEGLSKTLGFASSTNSIQEIRKADCILVIGVDPAQSHPIIKNEIHLAIRRNRAQLLVLGNYDIGLSRATQLSPLYPSSILLLEKPGMEVSLLNAMIGIILKEGLEDRGFIEERTEGIEELREKQGEYLEYLKTLSEEKRSEIQKAARAFAQSKKAMILIGSGLWSPLDSKEMAIASSNLALITGHMGKESSGILYLLEKSNSQGAIDMGLFSKREGNGVPSLLQKVEQGELKALYLVGKNPGLAPEALENLELLVVQDLFMTEAAQKAHVVLPSSVFVEKEGTYTNLERRIQRLHPIRSPKGQSRSDFEILLGLLRRLEAPVPGETPEAIFQEISNTIPCYQGIQDKEQWPEGARYLYEKGFPIGKAKLIPLPQPKPPPQPESYPFCLLQRPSLFQSGQLSLRSDHLKTVSEKSYLEVNPEDARSLDMEEGETVQVSTPVGHSLKIKLNVSPRPTPGVITIPCPCSLIDEKGWASVKVEKLEDKEGFRGSRIQEAGQKGTY